MHLLFKQCGWKGKWQLRQFEICKATCVALSRCFATGVRCSALRYNKSLLREVTHQRSWFHLFFVRIIWLMWRSLTLHWKCVTIQLHFVEMLCILLCRHFQVCYQIHFPLRVLSVEESPVQINVRHREVWKLPIFQTVTVNSDQRLTFEAPDYTMIVMLLPLRKKKIK